jgi:hypothetical protein
MYVTSLVGLANAVFVRPPNEADYCNVQHDVVYNKKTGRSQKDPPSQQWYSIP